MRSPCPLSHALSPAFLAALLASSCGNVTVGGATPGPAAFVELEPNDTPAMADFITVTDRWSHLTVEGYVQAIGVDVVDHLEFQAAEPMELTFHLTAHAPFGDVDVTIYDPIAGVVLGTYASGGPSEVGSLLILEPGRPFQFVIDAFVEDTPWCLELEGWPLPLGATGPDEPAHDEPGPANGEPVRATAAAAIRTDAPAPRAGVVTADPSAP